MTEETQADTTESHEIAPSRRVFLSGAVGGSLMAAAAPSVLRAQTVEPKAPPGIGKRAMYDCRFPSAYETSVPTALGLLGQYFSAMARRDVAGMARLLHFPYSSFEGVEPIVWESARDYIAKPPASVDPSGRGDSQIGAGMYDMLDNIQLHTFNPVNVGLELVWTRYAPDGDKMGQYQTIHAITNNDGRWAIQLSSTIFTPVGQTGVEYADAVEANLRESRDWMLGYSVRDAKILATRRGIEGRRTASIIGPGAVPFLQSQGGDVMKPYRFKGVTSRLRIMEPGAPRDRQDFAFGIFYDTAGGGVGDYGYTMILPDERVLHATVDKAHTYGGYIRYTKDNRPVSETRSLNIMTYDGINKRWGGAGQLGQSMYHDYTNDRRS